MIPDKLHIHKRPKLNKPALLLGFSGWMNGGEVSTGTVKLLVEKLGAEKLAEIEPEGFYLHSFPGSMEMTAMFRPHAKIKNGLVTSFEKAADVFLYSERANLILFLGKEPNLLWREFANCIFSLCREFGVETMYFIGSVSGLVPHTREPRIFCSVSDAALKEKLERYGVKFTDYEGPASIATYLTANCSERGLKMISLVATVPIYVQGNNPKCIEAVTRHLANILGLQIELDDLRDTSDDFEKRLSDAIQEQPELAESIHKLEENYDNEIFDSELGDLKKWLEQQGVRLD
jgi:proteasome assembly chaperone (PAC2) family protein